MTLLLIYLSVHAIGYTVALGLFAKLLWEIDREEQMR